MYSDYFKITGNGKRTVHKEGWVALFKIEDDDYFCGRTWSEEDRCRECNPEAVAILHIEWKEEE